MARTPDHRRHRGRAATGAVAASTCSSTARRSPRCTRPGTAGRPGGHRRPHASTPPASTSSPAASTSHTHMELPFGGTFASDTFETGTRGGGLGRHDHDHRLRRAAHRRASCRTASPPGTTRPTGNCAIDYGFHMIIGGVDDDSLKAMDELVEHEGITSFKLFMAYPGVFYSDDGQILRAMQKAADNGAMIMMHAENGIAIDVLVAQALARGETDPTYHGITRPVGAGGRGDAPGHRARQGGRQRARSTSCTCRRRRRSRRWRRPRRAARNVFAETCPQYLYLTLEDHLGAPGFEGAKYVCSHAAAHRARAPPARTCGRPAHRTTSRSSPPTTARSASRTRRSSASATSRRSPTASAASSTAWTSSTRAWSTAS